MFKENDEREKRIEENLKLIKAAEANNTHMLNIMLNSLTFSKSFRICVFFSHTHFHFI